MPTTRVPTPKTTLSPKADVSHCLQPARQQRLQAVVNERTRNVTVVLETVEMGHNQSATLRSCDAFGVQEVHIIHSHTAPFAPLNKITQGCDKWLDLHLYNDATAAVQALKKTGYTLMASCFVPEAKPLPKLDLTGRIALFFGNEKEGISTVVREACDELFVIPMLGFSQSFNISVAASLALYEVTRQRIARFGQNGDLSEKQRAELFELFVQRSLRPDRILAGKRYPKGRSRP